MFFLVKISDISKSFFDRAKLNLVRRTNHICLDDQQRKGEGSVTVNSLARCLTFTNTHVFATLCIKGEQS